MIIEWLNYVDKYDFMEDYSDYIDLEEIKRRAKQATCEHKDFFIMIKCVECSKSWSEKNLHLGLKNEIIKK